MAPRLHCVRHAQGHHNVGVSNYGIPDPLLTELGEKQCARLAQNYPYHSTTELLVSSPLRRTLYTTLLSFQTETDKGIKIIALPELQETSDLPCDTGSDLDVLTEEFMGKPVDLARVQKGWNSKKGQWDPAAEFVEQRATAARQWLKSRPERDVVVVTHGGFLHYFSGDWSDSNSHVGTGWDNTEFRSYDFTNPSDDSNSIRETEESRQRRRGTGSKPLSEAEQVQLRQTAEREWERQS